VSNAKNIKDKIAPCLSCGSTDIRLEDFNYSSFNQGGGCCLNCGNTVYSGVSCIATREDLLVAWNAGNDILRLIAAEEAKIAVAQARIAELKAKQGVTLKELTAAEKADSGYMTAEEFIHSEAVGALTCDDGDGVWATATKRSDISTNLPKPDWATHVLWFNR
jgi:hypothetical protein